MRFENKFFSKQKTQSFLSINILSHRTESTSTDFSSTFHTVGLSHRWTENYCYHYFFFFQESNHKKQPSSSYFSPLRVYCNSSQAASICIEHLASLILTASKGEMDLADLCAVMQPWCLLSVDCLCSSSSFKPSLALSASPGLFRWRFAASATWITDYFGKDYLIGLKSSWFWVLSIYLSMTDCTCLETFCNFDYLNGPPSTLIISLRDGRIPVCLIL